MVEGIRTNWNEGRLDVQGFEGASFAKERKEIQVSIAIAPSSGALLTLFPRTARHLLHETDSNLNHSFARRQVSSFSAFNHGSRKSTDSSLI